MRLAEIREMLTNSTASDWNKITCWGAGTGPSYRNVFESWQSSGEVMQTGVDSHGNTAVFREDVNLSVAWGLDRDNRWWDRSDRGLSFSFEDNFPDSKITVLFADVFWAGTLVDRHYLMAVDGGRAYLPLSQVRKVGAGMGPDSYEEYFVEESLPIARLFHSFEHAEDFDRYVAQSGLPVAPGDAYSE